MKRTIQGIIKQADKRAKSAGQLLRLKKTRVELIIDILNKESISPDTINNHRTDSKAFFNEDPFDQETIEILKSIHYIHQDD